MTSIEITPKTVTSIIMDSTLVSPDLGFQHFPEAQTVMTHTMHISARPSALGTGHLIAIFLANIPTNAKKGQNSDNSYNYYFSHILH